ncbi:type 1 glutamine amidotransferase [Amycolatopsis eburnea]|uniref:Lipid II isoglutaminyl synthase (glutamine-hydrolyzing) subunit GatD n=1 Tax=Amycolatopsis eburnea TaxID=2267691 RepID=A0A3R9E427_9PSEU|nr:glutamine amidotransferase [Amycolatopsis eburnea]RSD19412.1 glutamine amidotransferase [Amycolatopsis eburnea]
MAESVVHIGLLLPEVLGTYGDTGNAQVLCRRLRWRGLDAEVVPVGLGEPVPSTLDLYLLGGGEDGAQALAAAHLRKHWRSRSRGAVVFGVCAGLQVLGTRFRGLDGVDHDGLGLLDVSTEPGERRAVAELVATSSGLLPEPLTGFENHLGVSKLGADSEPLGTVVRGTGNGDGTEGAVTDRVIGTYLHGPALARNPELADLLLSWVAGHPLPPLDLPEVDRLRTERLTTTRRRR